MATRELRVLLQEKLSGLAGHAYYGTAPASAEYLYLVYNLEEISFEDGLSLQELEVDVVDYGTDTAPAESMADTLQQSLDHFQVLTDTLEVSIYRERRQPVYENDRAIIRRRLTFQVRLYERSE